jgi:Tfp pilus assembly protein PilZ
MSPADRHDFLKFSIKDTTSLQANYMVVENGGLFRLSRLMTRCTSFFN